MLSLSLVRAILFAAAVVAAKAEGDICEEGSCTEFLQRSVDVDASGSKSQLQLQSRGELKGGFNCSGYPSLCKEPFNCQNYTNYTAPPAVAAIAKNGQPNLQSWCQSPQYHEYVGQCLGEQDLVKAAHTQYNNTLAGKHGDNTFDMDGSYCFIEGHCLNTAVNANTTLQEANTQCDARYGHETWTTMGDAGSSETKSFVGAMAAQEAKAALAIGGGTKGFSSQEQTRGFLLLACAMGNYHCDVMYCKETYCKNPDMVKKYGHFLWENGWTKFTEPWFVGTNATSVN